MTGRGSRDNGGPRLFRKTRRRCSRYPRSGSSPSTGAHQRAPLFRRRRQGCAGGCRKGDRRLRKGGSRGKATDSSAIVGNRVHPRERVKYRGRGAGSGLGKGKGWVKVGGEFGRGGFAVEGPWRRNRRHRQGQLCRIDNTRRHRGSESTQDEPTQTGSRGER